MSLVILYGKVKVSISYASAECKIKSVVRNLKQKLRENNDLDLIKFVNVKNLYKFTQDKSGHVYYFVF